MGGRRAFADDLASQLSSKLPLFVGMVVTCRSCCSWSAHSVPGPVTATTSSGNSHILAVVSFIVAGFDVVLALLRVWLGRARLLGAESLAETDLRVSKSG